MTAGGRFLVRLAANAGFAITAAAAVVFTLSDLPSLRALGILIGLFVLDAILHAGASDFSRDHAASLSRVNVARCLAPAGYRVLEAAFERSRLSHTRFGDEVLSALSGRREIRAVFERLDVTPQALAKALAARSNQGPGGITVAELACGAYRMLRTGGTRGITPLHLFGALASSEDAALARVSELLGVTLEDVGYAVTLTEASFARSARTKKRLLHGRHAHRVMNRAWTAKPTPFLDSFSTDLTDLAREGAFQPLAGHEQSYEALLAVLARPGSSNALLVGDPGSGKGSVVRELARMIVKDAVPRPLLDRRVVELSLGALVAGASGGELALRAEKIVAEIVGAGNIILAIPDVHDLVKAGSQASLSLADVLLPLITGDALSVIGETYPREFKTYIEPASDFSAAFERIPVLELSEGDATRYLLGAMLDLEKARGITVSLGAVREAVTAAHRYFHDKLLPGGAEELLGAAVAAVESRRGKLVQRSDVTAAAERRVNVPLRSAGSAEATELLNLEATIHETLVDQDEAVAAVSRALREYRSGLRARRGPIASFLFVGPTGVGKTELAKILARVEFQDERAMLRFDMSEFQELSSIERFIGSADGSVRGALTDAVREKPYTLILLDEFEKAHLDILNLFLQVLDDARLTDGLGRTVDFSNTIIIATSNAHSETVKARLEAGVPMADITRELKQALVDSFRAELLNRFSAIVVFKSLTPEDVRRVAELRLREFAASVRASHGIELVFESSALELLARLGYEPSFGARPLERAMNDKIRAVLAERILEKAVTRGSRVVIGGSGDDFTFHA
jgi:ATP-dependent Clp protease ATP-binding subunit ClpC